MDLNEYIFIICDHMILMVCMRHYFHYVNRNICQIADVKRKAWSIRKSCCELHKCSECKCPKATAPLLNWQGVVSSMHAGSWTSNKHVNKNNLHEKTHWESWGATYRTGKQNETRKRCFHLQSSQKTKKVYTSPNSSTAHKVWPYQA